MNLADYTRPDTNPRARLQELLEHTAVSPEIAALRLAVLRQDVPATVVQIDSVRADDTAIAVKVTIGLPTGGRHTDIAAMDVDPNRSWATQHDDVTAIAITRALDGLGILAGKPTAGDSAPRQQPVESPAKPATAPRSETDHLTEYSWTSFWQAAHARNITREQVEQALGKSIQESTPKEAIEVLRSSDLWS